MNATIEMLKPTEAAVVARVSVRDVNRVIDEGILPSALWSLTHGRRIKPAACALISFYFESADLLTSDERLFTIRAALPAVKKWRNLVVHNLLEEDWVVRHSFLSVDLRPFVSRTAEGLSELEAARNAVERSPDVMGGAPVVRGTRILVHDIGASVVAGIPMERLLAAYPSLDPRTIELAAIYAQAEPLRGRPRGSLPKGAVIVSERTIPRRTGR